MRLELTKIVKETKTVYLRLTNNEVIVTDEHGTKLCALIRFNPDGSIHLYKWVPPDLGFELDKYERISVNKYYPVGEKTHGT